MRQEIFANLALIREIFFRKIHLKPSIRENLFRENFHK